MKEVGLDPSSPMHLLQIQFLQALCARLFKESSLVEAFLQVRNIATPAMCHIMGYNNTCNGEVIVNSLSVMTTDDDNVYS